MVACDGGARLLEGVGGRGGDLGWAHNGAGGKRATPCDLVA